MKDTVSLRINAPVERVWKVTTDLERSPEVIQGIEKVNILEPPSKAFQVGTTWEETRTMMGSSSTETMKVTKVEVNQQYVVEAESCGCHYISTFDFMVIDKSTTELRMTFAGETLTWFASIMSFLTSWMMKGAMRKMLEQDLDDVKVECEKQT